MSKRKKILLLSDDLRMTSGVARMSFEIVRGTIHKYDWIQLAGAIQHPEHGQILNINGDERIKIPKGGSLKLYPVSGYGDADRLFEIIKLEKPDAILHYTDPRFWIWLYNIEHEVRTQIPIFYYNIWDDLPDPLYNRNYYRSSDLLMAISKQTYGINKRVVPEYEDWQITYVPHGVDADNYHSIDKSDLRLTQFETKLDINNYNFKILFCNRNIRRKMPGDVILAFKHFCDMLPKDEADKCILVMHTPIVDENGTDLGAIHRDICPNYNIKFTEVKLNDNELNLLYNSCDVTINIASNEGFGLATCESLMAGTPTIINVTGGLQDQCGFKNEDGEYLTENDYIGEWGSNHNGKYQEHGEWVKTVFPSTISLMGSPVTPYIFDDRCRWDETGEAMKYWYDKTPDERKEAGKKGREFVIKEGMTSEKMSDNFITSMDTVFEKWKPKEKYTLEVV
tara:strand:- start:45898 stop:47253 length:1356 start_codon:yes stop_codon:yes gene_type:complete